MKKIIVVGSANTDMVVKTPRFPRPGETILGGRFFMFQGGKGANQAVAASRAGGAVSFICALGDDVFGANAKAAYAKEGLDVSMAAEIPGKASGVALITVDETGENEIVVASGTNAHLTQAHLESVLGGHKGDAVVLTQLETPIPGLIYLAEHCRASSWPLILNPAPAQSLPPELLKGLYLITPNETEAELLTGQTVHDEQTAAMAADVLLGKGVCNVIITMGSKGAFFKNAKDRFMVPAPQVQAVDTTAAGDVFNGVLSVCLAQGKSWRQSMEIANRAAALSVTKMGAQDSAPYKEEFNLNQ